MDGDILDAYNQTKLTGHAPTINARLNQNNNIFVAKVETMTERMKQTEAVVYDDYNGRFVPGNVTNALTTNIGSGAERNGQKVMITEVRTRFRKFTPRECFRLMDVSEEDIDRIQAAGISESQQYKMAGNSIVVAVLYGIFERLFIDAPDTEPTLF